MDHVMYTVRPGNTVYGIAQFFGTTANDIANANALVYPYTIYPGQELVIPVPAVSSPKYYVVRPGDNLYALADRYGIELSTLLTLNNLENPNVIYPGQIIRLMK